MRQSLLLLLLAILWPFFHCEKDSIPNPVAIKLGYDYYEYCTFVIYLLSVSGVVSNVDLGVILVGHPDRDNSRRVAGV